MSQKTLSFPALPDYNDRGEEFCLDPFRGDTRAKELMKNWEPFAYVHLPDIKGDKDIIFRFNQLFQDFLVGLHKKHTHRISDHVRELESESGVANIYFPDGFIHDHSKLHLFDRSQDNNISGWCGVLIRNHREQKSKTYGLMRTVRAFAEYLRSQQIPFQLFLRNMQGEQVEVTLD